MTSYTMTHHDCTNCLLVYVHPGVVSGPFKKPLMVDWFTVSKQYTDKNINSLSSLYSLNLNVPTIAFQPFFIR